MRSLSAWARVLGETHIPGSIWSLHLVAASDSSPMQQILFRGKSSVRDDRKFTMCHLIRMRIHWQVEPSQTAKNPNVCDSERDVAEGRLCNWSDRAAFNNLALGQAPPMISSAKAVRALLRQL